MCVCFRPDRHAFPFPLFTKQSHTWLRMYISWCAVSRMFDDIISLGKKHEQENLWHYTVSSVQSISTGALVQASAASVASQDVRQQVAVGSIVFISNSVSGKLELQMLYIHQC